MPTENRSSKTEQMVSVPDGYMLVERSIWTEQQVEAATACITRLKVVPGMSDRNLAMAAIDAAQCKAPAITLADFQPAAQHQADGYSAGDMADQGAKAFAARDGEVEELRRALGGMLFAFDDGVGKSWSQDLLDYARKLTLAAEFKPAE